MVEHIDRIVRELDRVPAQNGRLDWGGDHANKSITKEQIEEMEVDYFHCFVKKAQHASADCRNTRLFSEDIGKRFGCKIPHHPRAKSVRYNLFTLIVVDKHHTM